MTPEILPPEPPVRVVVRPHPFREAKQTALVPAGRSIAELLVLAGLPPEHAGPVRVDGVRVPREEWAAHRPPAGALVTGHRVPLGSATNKNGPFRGFLAFVTIGTSELWRAAYKRTGFVANSMFWQPDLPDVSFPGGPGRAARPFITGTRNELRPYGVVPQVFGYRVRYRPPYAAKPYSSWQGNRQRWHCLMTFGHGPLRLESLKFGDTPIESLGLTAVGHGATRAQLDAAQIQIREGWSDDDTIAYYLDQVDEAPMAVDLRRDNSDGSRTAPSIRRTPPDVSRIGVEVYFPQGLIDFSGANPAKLDAEVEVFYAAAGTAVPASGDLAGAPGWTAVYGKDEKGNRNKYAGIKVNDSRRSPFAVALDWDVTAGEYDVALRRKTGDRNSITKLDTTIWSILRTWKLGNPVNLTGLCTVSFDIISTGNLTGDLDAFNAEASWMGTYYDSGTAAWVTPTRTSTPTLAKSAQPAAHFRSVLQGSANRSPVADGRIDLSGLATWAVACETAGLHFNGVFETPGTVFDRLQSVSGIGRASPHMKDGKFSVASDLTAPGAALEKFTPREYTNFQGDIAFPEATHALYVEYVQQSIEGLDRIIVYDDGYNAAGTGGNTAATRFDTLTLLNCRDKDEAWKHGRRALAERRLRRETWSFDVPDAHLSVTRGDCVEVGIESIDTVLAWGRVKTVTLNGGGDAVSITTDEGITLDGVSSYLFRFRKASGVSLDASIGTPAAATDSQSFTFSSAIVSGNPQPVAGDLFLFGKATTDFRRCLIQRIEHRPDFWARVTVVDEATSVYTADTSTAVSAQSSASAAPAASASGSEAVLSVSASSPASTSNGSAGIVVSISSSGRTERAPI